jgi:hypothetical protein
MCPHSVFVEKRRRAHKDLMKVFVHGAEPSMFLRIILRRAETYRGNGLISEPASAFWMWRKIGQPERFIYLSQRGPNAHVRPAPGFSKKRCRAHDDSLKVFVRGPETCVASDAVSRDARGHRCVGYLLEKSRVEENIEHTDFDFGRENQCRRTSHTGSEVFRAEENMVA